MFPFHENILFSELSFKQKCTKAASFRKWVFLHKYEIFVTKTSIFFLLFRSTFRWQYLSKKVEFSVRLQQKQAIGQLFVEDVYIFLIISFKKRDCRITDLFFFLLYGNEGSLITFLKICCQKLGYCILLATSNIVILLWFYVFIFIFMVIAFRTMCNKNQFFYNTRGNYKNINLNILLAKKYNKTLLTYNKSKQKIIMNL